MARDIYDLSDKCTATRLALTVGCSFANCGEIFDLPARKSRYSGNISKKHAKNDIRLSRSSAPRARARLDRFNRDILQVLIENARASNVLIAEKVRLSEAPCSRRVRRLEAEGVIERYSTQLNPDAVGIGSAAFATLVLNYVTASIAERFYVDWLLKKSLCEACGV
jgi:hypothetical protein